MNRSTLAKESLQEDDVLFRNEAHRSYFILHERTNKPYTMPSRKRHRSQGATLVNSTDSYSTIPRPPPHVYSHDREDREASGEPKKHGDLATRHRSRAHAFRGKLHKVATEDGLVNKGIKIRRSVGLTPSAL